MNDVIKIRIISNNFRALTSFLTHIHIDSFLWRIFNEFIKDRKLVQTDSKQKDYRLKSDN